MLLNLAMVIVHTKTLMQPPGGAIQCFGVQVPSSAKMQTIVSGIRSKAKSVVNDEHT